MRKQKTPAYFVYGHDEQERLAFFQRFCHAKNPLLVQMAGDGNADLGQSVCGVSADMSPGAISSKIAQRLRQKRI